MSTHTPGPWAYDDVRVYAPAFDKKVVVTRDDGTVHEHGRGLVALPYSCGPLGAEFGGCQANARLIAAAPELLGVLKACAALLDDYSDVDDGGSGPVANRATALLQEVTAAIAHAEGRS
jgi:hypothetical protein